VTSNPADGRLIYADEAASTPPAAARPLTRIYRRADGSYLTVRTEADGTTVQKESQDRPQVDGGPVPLQWNLVTARLDPGPDLDALVADLDRAGGRVADADLVRRLAAALAADPRAAGEAGWLAIGSDVRADCRPDGWVGKKAKARKVELRVVFFL
jgi:hypothetical protein